MPTITVTNIPPELYERLKNSARDHRRTLSDEIIIHLEKALRRERIDPTTLLARLDALQQKIILPLLNDEFLETAKAYRRK